MVCDCQQHPDDCQDCHCIGGGKVDPEKADLVLSLASPQGTMSHAPWFGTAVPSTIAVGIEAHDLQTGDVITFPFRMNRVSEDPLLFEADSSFDATAYSAWSSSVDRQRGVSVHIAAISDPATWEFVDGDVTHVNESLDTRFYLRNAGDTEWIEVYYAESTPAWESWTYLRSMASLIPDDAFAEGVSPAATRDSIYSELDTWQLVLAASNYESARSILESLAANMEVWLRPEHEATAPAICAVRKIHHLISPGEQEVCPE